MKIFLKIIIIALLFSACENDNSIQVKFDKVQRKTIVQKVTAVGKIEPETTVEIASEVSGELIYLGAKEGDTVRTGQLLARIKPDIIEMQLEGQKAAVEAAETDIDFSEAQVEQTKNNYNRIKGLYEQKYSSLQELEQAKASYDQAVSSYQNSIARLSQAKATLKQTQRNADRTTIISPIEGIVTSLPVEIGEKILGTIQTQGTQLMNVSDLSVINAEVEVDENDIVLLDLNDSVDVEIDAFPDKIFKGYVLEIGHSAITSNTGSQDEITNFKVTVRLRDTDTKIRPGMSCSVKIKTEIKENVLAVPLSSVTLREKKSDQGSEDKPSRSGMVDRTKKAEPKPVIFTSDSSKAVQKYVELGISDQGFIEIKSGLEEGEQIISGPYSAVSKDLYDGAVVSKFEGFGGQKKWGRGGR